MNAIRWFARVSSATTPLAAIRTRPSFPIVLARSFAVPPKRSDAETPAPPSPKRTSFYTRMPSAVVSRRSTEGAPAAASAQPPPPLDSEFRSMSIAELKRLAAARGINTSGFFEKDDFVRALLQPPTPPQSSLVRTATPAGASPVPTADPPRPFANMPVENPDTQIQVNDNPSPEVVSRGLSVLMAQPYVMIKRRLEMFNIMIGFEQNNQFAPPPSPTFTPSHLRYSMYTIYGASGEVIGYIVEDSQGLMGVAWRNMAHTHRPFTARIMDHQGNIILKVSRGFFFFTSSLSVTRHDGSIIGEIEQQFTVLRRKYSLFTKQAPDGEKQQFGLVNAPTLSLNFNVEDDNYNVIAAIDRDFASFGDVLASMFMDKSSYVVHLRAQDNALYDGRLSYINTPEGAASFFSTDKTPQERALEGPKALSGAKRDAIPSSGSSVMHSSNGHSSGLSVPAQPMTFEQKAVVLGAAISIDFDYFSRHSSSSNPGILGGMGGLFGGFGGDGGDYSDTSAPHDSSPTPGSNPSSDAGSSGDSGFKSGGGEPSPSHGKYGEELDPDSSETMEDKWDVFTDDD